MRNLSQGGSSDGGLCSAGRDMSLVWYSPPYDAIIYLQATGSIKILCVSRCYRPLGPRWSFRLGWAYGILHLKPAPSFGSIGGLRCPAPAGVLSEDRFILRPVLESRRLSKEIGYLSCWGVPSFVRANRRRRWFVDASGGSRLVVFCFQSCP